MRPLRVLHVINSLVLAGAEVLVTDLVPRLRQRGVLASVAVLTLVDSRLERAIADLPGGLVYGERRSVTSPMHAFRLAELMRDYDVVHSHLTHAQYWVAMAALFARSRPRLVTTEHNPDNSRRGKFLWSLPDNWMYHRYDAIVCNSQATADVLNGWVPAVREKTTVIPNGISFDRFRAESRVVRDGPYLTAIFVARLVPQKDHRTLFTAIRSVPNIRLQLVGAGVLRDELQAYCAELGISDRVEFLGLRDDIPALLKAADIYVHATHSDGFAISMVEAMAAGLPVIASNVPGLSSVLGDAGVFCKPEDAADLAAQLSRVAADVGLRKSLASRSVARAQQFSIERTADAHVALYESMNAGCRGEK